MKMANVSEANERIAALRKEEFLGKQAEADIRMQQQEQERIRFLEEKKIEAIHKAEHCQRVV